MLFECKNTKRKRVKQIFCDFWVDELCKKGGLPQCLLGKIYFHDRFWTPYLTRQSVRYYKSKCGLQKTYFLPFILTFILVNSELRNFSSDRVTANSLIFSKLRGHWSLVTYTFTLSFMYYTQVSDLVNAWAESPKAPSPGQAKRHPGLWIATALTPCKGKSIRCWIIYLRLLPLQGVTNKRALTQGVASLALG